MFSASCRVVASGTVGPDATSAGLSPGISETTSDTTRAGCAKAASRPPLMVETCLRTQFIAEIGAPEASSASLTAISSAKVSSPAGAGSSAEPPPQTSAMTRSSGVRPETSSVSRLAAFKPASSGTGCEASSTSMFFVGAA